MINELIQFNTFLAAGSAASFRCDGFVSCTLLREFRSRISLDTIRHHVLGSKRVI